MNDPLPAQTELVLTKLPNHLAIIMDGNGRWAKEKGENRLVGHYKGVETVRMVVEECAMLKIPYLSLYAFSTENWNRPQTEVDGLMELLIQTIDIETPVLNKNNIRLHLIGNLSALSPSVRKKLLHSLHQTKNNTGLQLIMAISYSASWEIVNATKQIAEEVKQGLINVTDINETVFEKKLLTANFPNPELLIRTSGEFRISNFMLYQIAYCELYFTPVLWPNFNKADLYAAILDFQKRQRRFGKISEQIDNQ